jgi:hypothetical protein
MSSYRRPWWLIVNRPAGLITTVKEESAPGERVFIIRGEPLVQGLAWLTWGPVSAVLVVFLLAGLALAFQVREQATAIQGGVIVAFLALPALAWVGATIILNRLSQKHLQAERQADTHECRIRLKQDTAELLFRPRLYAQEQRLAYDQIRQARISYPLGERTSKTVRLTLDTDAGPVTLLGEELGSRLQKVDLANEIQQALKAYAGH